MKTWRMIIGMAAATGLLIACSEDPKKKNEDDGGGGSGAASTTTTTGATTTTTGATTTSTGSGGGSCYSEAGALAAPGMTTQTGLNHCTAQEITGFYDACLGASATQQTCTDYQTASADCFNCILPVDENGNADGASPVLLVGNDTGMGSSVYVNVYACEAAAQGLPQCGPPASQLVFCGTTACETCASEAESDACFGQATSAGGICGDNISVPTECDPVLNAAELSAECAGADFQAIYTSIATYFCGAP